MSHICFSDATDQFTKVLILMSFTFDYLVFIGRFQPFHLAHLQTIEIALQHSQQVILALGSAQAERNIKNPFLAQEREQMILSNFSPADQARIQFVHVIDVYNDEKWQKLVHSLVAQRVEADAKVGLIGHFKDESSYYLKLFPQWPMLSLESLKQSISATPLREAYYRGVIDVQAFPTGTIAFLQQFQRSAIYAQLQAKFQQGDGSSLTN